MSDPRDNAFRQLLDTARRFNQNPSLTRRIAVVGAAFTLVDAHNAHVDSIDGDPDDVTPGGSP